MKLPEKHPSKGILTFLCEGSNNPLSKNYSRKMRLDSEGCLIIGRGYNLSKTFQNNIIMDLRDAGVSEKNIEIASRAQGLIGTQAKQYLKSSGLDFSMTEKQDIALFEIIYEGFEREFENVLRDNTRHYGYIDMRQLPEPHQELLLDFYFTKDYDKVGYDSILQNLWGSVLYKDPSIFDKLIMDTNFWKSKGLNEDRVRYRCIYIKEREMILGI